MAGSLVVGLHGFLGQGSDFAELKEQLAMRFKDLDFYCPDLLSAESELSPALKFCEWSKLFNKKVAAYRAENNFLIGYSMGGRLALHALNDQPELYSGAIFLSTNPLLVSAEQRQLRLSKDKEWAERFVCDSWDKLISDWDNQEVFASDGRKNKLSESNFKRDHLSQALTNWSLAQHKFALADLSTIFVRQKWFVGEKDKKFVAIAEALVAQQLKAAIAVVPNHGHRLLAKPKQELCAGIFEFLQDCLNASTRD